MNYSVIRVWRDSLIVWDIFGRKADYARAEVWAQLGAASIPSLARGEIIHVGLFRVGAP